MRINNNIMALNAHRQLAVNQSNASKSMERLSSGMRINRAGDDAAGLAISEKMRGQIRGLKQAQRNAQDAISLIQTAEGALNETHAILQRMRELADQSATDTNTDADRLEIQKEVTQLTREIDRIARTTQFNTMELLNGDYKDMYFHIGANMDQNLAVDIQDMRAEALGILGTEPPELDDTGGTEVPEATVATVEASGDGASNISDVAIDTESELDGVYTLDITWDTTKAIATLKDSNGNVVGGPTDVFAGQNTIGDITFSIDGAKIPTQTTDGFSVTLTVTQTTEDETPPVDGDEPFDESTMHGINVFDRASANKALETIDKAIALVSEERSKLGAIQNRLEHTIANLGTSAENLQAAESRIRDLDMAEEIMAFTKNNILQQAATAMLAQANMAPQSVLQLLG
jgi:flagellin